MIENLRQISSFIWELPKTYRKSMKVPVKIIASQALLQNFDEAVFAQAINVASLPGLVDFVYILPDAHSGYGAPIGCVFATDPNSSGVISPGAVGYDINCGMRLLTTNLRESDIRPYLEKLVNEFFYQIPAGVGGKGFLKISQKELNEVVTKGAKWAIEKGYGIPEDLECIEENGAIAGANPEFVSEKAVKRGIGQLATLGSGNHYLEIQKVTEIYDNEIAKSLGIDATGQITVMLHCGSRGFGHQICSDYLSIFENHMDDYQIKVLDRQLACTPFKSPHGQRYFGAMAAAANFGFANRQAITSQVRGVFEKVFGGPFTKYGLELVYDVCHNIAKLEKFVIDGQEKTLLIHRKGATRSYPGQPVIIGGSMESGSFLLLGTENALSTTFGSTAHGSGRTMSRHAAARQVSGKNLSDSLKLRGIYVRSASWGGLAEEAGIAYKNIDEVVEAVEGAGISQKVAKLTPLGNIKG